MMELPIWLWWMCLLSLGFNIGWCIHFHHKQIQLEHKALDTRPLVSDENTAILRDGDSLIVHLGKAIDADFAKHVAKHAASLSERGIKLYPIIDIADRHYLVLLGKQPLLEEPASVKQADDGNKDAP